MYLGGGRFFQFSEAVQRKIERKEGTGSQTGIYLNHA